MPSSLTNDIRHLLNCYSAETRSDTPDYILAEYLMSCLDAFNAAVNERDRWHGFEPWAALKEQVDAGSTAGR